MQMINKKSISDIKNSKNAWILISDISFEKNYKSYITRYGFQLSIYWQKMSLMVHTGV